MSDPTHILTVSDLNRQARLTIEQTFQTVWVTGEMSNFARPRSGHWYFSLKDQGAQVRCAMFVNRNRAVQMQPSDGQQVLIRGRVSLYEGRGEFQIIVDQMEPAGEGALRQAFDQLKRKLAEEGLFDSIRKQTLPQFPKRVAVITSPSGAAYQDILAVWQRRYPVLEVILIPAMVQGNEAEAQLISGLERAADLAPDVILLTRGGGSLEDLWSFNGEALARAVAASSIPVVSAVGHEIDTTISDLVADMRAPTPSAAAELIVPDIAELLSEFAAYESHLGNMTRRYLEHQALKARNLLIRLPNPNQVIERLAQRIDDASNRLQLGQQSRLHTATAQLTALHRQLTLVGPENRLSELKARLEHLTQLNTRAVRQTLSKHADACAQLSRMLHGVSPLPTLARGYAVLRQTDGRVISSSDELTKGQPFTAVLNDGTVHGEVVKISDETLEGGL